MSAPDGLLHGDSHDNEKDAVLGILCDRKEIVSSTGDDTRNYRINWSVRSV